MVYNGAVDGMFTDVLIFGELTEEKVLSTPEDPSKGVVTGIETVCEKVGISFPDLHLLARREVIEWPSQELGGRDGAPR
jgi:N-methylhydantoinase A